MKGFLSKVWFPVAVVAAVTAQVIGPEERVESRRIPAHDPDTVIYAVPGYKKGWEEDALLFAAAERDSLALAEDSLGFFTDEEKVDSVVKVRPAALDTLIAPDSLQRTDAFRFKYYAALLDSASHVWIRDSLRAAGDSLDWPKLDSIYRADSIAVAKEAFERWYASLDKAARKKYDQERKNERKLAELKLRQRQKDSLQTHRDSVRAATPRILETFALTDYLQYKRLIAWERDRNFHKLDPYVPDTTANYWFHDYPFLRKDVGAAWLGVAGSPVQSYDFFQRKSTEGVSFYEAQESWTYSAATLPFYNTKTPYTELAYWGTIFAPTKKESDNLRILTTQNITPELNLTLQYDRYGGGGILNNETTANKTFVAATNYLGRKYMMHAGYIYNMVRRSENGGIRDNMWIRDTTVDAREITVALSKANSLIKKNTIFLDQQYRIPFYFLEDLFGRPEEELDEASAEEWDFEGEDDEETEGAPAGSQKDTTDVYYYDEDVTTAFIGHSTELSTYRRTYSDQITTKDERAYYDAYNYNPNTSLDSTRVLRLDNKLFLRLQPWSSEGVVSKLDVGVGYKLMRYFLMDPKYLSASQTHNWNSSYVYAGAEGQLRNYIHWNALGHYAFAGQEANDFDLEANAGLNFFPFRRARKSPVSLDVHFETSLKEPEFYEQHYMSNHFSWENDFSKKSVTKLEGEIRIPHWRLGASVGYALLDGNIYYGTDGIIRQNTTPMSVLKARLDKDFAIGDFLHFDHRLLFQLSSNQEVLPLPKLAANARYYVQLRISQGVLVMQIGADAYWNTAWYAPAWNPAVGVFHNQTETKYGNAPYFDAFVNMQWKRACIFVKLENAGQGWPLDKADYFSADHFIRTQRAFKFGIYWPFYTQPGKSTSSGSASGPDRGPSGSSGSSRPSGARLQ